MGRSPFFNIDTVEFPDDKPACSAVLETLQVGQCVRITCDNESPYSMRVHRTPSNYGCVTSSYNDVDLIVDNINVDPALNTHGVRAIAFREASISEDGHYYTWYVTTDGYVREREHYGIIQMLVTVKLL
jgi:hypothetical protein